MHTEFLSVLIILTVCIGLLTVLDLAVAGLLAWLLRLSFKRCFLWGLLSLLLPPLLLAYGLLIERNIYQVKRVEVTFDNLPAQFDGYRLVQLSDIHTRSFLKRPKSLGRCVDKVGSLRPDLIVFTGDIVTLSSSELESASHILAGLQAPDGIISIIGNHDYCTYGNEPDGKRRVVDLERQMGWTVLCNENLILRRGGDSLAIVGVENISTSKHFPTTGNLSQALVGTQGMFKILLSHDPTHWDREVVGKDIPLTLSGHTHASQFSILGWTPVRYMYKQYRGLYQKGRQYLYINIGLGETIFPARIGTPPEITLITLRTSKFPLPTHKDSFPHP